MRKTNIVITIIAIIIIIITITLTIVTMLYVVIIERESTLQPNRPNLTANAKQKMS